jgi:hypothetical protein
MQKSMTAESLGFKGGAGEGQWVALKQRVNMVIDSLSDMCRVFEPFFISTIFFEKCQSE